jgi:undecaprenyl-diphosphatase
VGKPMNFFDVWIIRYINAFSQHSWGFDHTVVQMVTNTLVKGGVMVALFWWAWNHDQDENSDQREFLLFGLFASISAVIIARVLALTLPFRARPLDNFSLHFQLPIGMDPGALATWSSFPSDHAALFFCFATGLWIVSKRLGSIAFCWALFVISLPRVSLGIHYPTDIVGGALLGMGVALLCRITWLRKSLTRPFLRWSIDYPAYFSACLFLLTFEMAEVFDSVRHLGLSGYHGVQVILQTLR